MAVLTWRDWQQRLLQQLRAPATPANLDFVNAWQRAEGGTASNNPFNTTLPMHGATPYNNLPNDIHVWKYPTPQVGLKATVSTLNEDRYAGLLRALQHSNQSRALDELRGSPWGTSAGLVSDILAGGPVTPSPLPAGLAPPSQGVPVAKKMSTPAAKPLKPIKPLPAFKPKPMQKIKKK